MDISASCTALGENGLKIVKNLHLEAVLFLPSIFFKKKTVCLKFLVIIIYFISESSAFTLLYGLLELGVALIFLLNAYDSVRSLK